MKKLILPLALALAVALPAAADARPLYDSEVSTPAPAASAPADDGTLGYILVGLGGLALGAAGTVSVRRVATA